MTSDERRKAILQTLRQCDAPCNATCLAKTFGVSRQVVVADVALLRASGIAIQATPRGYVIGREETGVVRRVACCHSGEDTRQELNVMVDNGCTVLDVVVEHPVYGELIGALRLKSRYDVDQFVNELSGARPLSVLTEGIHLHTLVCPDEAAFARVCAALSQAGFLLEESMPE